MKVPEHHPGSIVRTQDVPPTAWKNGTGVTREIAARRTSGDTARLAWRISVADLTRDAGFSRFPGVHRTFVVVSRARVVLEVDGVAAPLRLGESLTFPGEAEARVSLPEGPATALNLMTSPGWNGLVRVAAVEGKPVVRPSTEAILVLEGGASTSRGEVLEPMDVLLCGTDTEILHFTRALAVFVEVSGPSSRHE